MKNVEKIKIKNIAKGIQIGYQFYKRIEPSPRGTHRVIQVRDIDENHNLCPDNLFLVSPNRLTERYLVNKGDILFLSRGHRNFATSVEITLDNTIAAGYFFILRLDTEKLLPAYLAWYINQVPAQNYLRSKAGGSHMPVIRKSDFVELEITIPPLPVQENIIRLDTLQRKESALLKQLEEKRSFLIQSICLKAAKN
jgi:restriction endonuclease S subunit